MKFFYFNDCIPSNAENHVLVKCLESTLNEFNEVKKEYPDSVDGIITEKEPFNNFLNETGYSLGQCINDLEPKSKRLAYSVFNKYPIDNLFQIDNEDEILEEGYLISLSLDKLSAINLAIAKQNEGLLFTLSIHEELRRNQLVIEGKNSSITIDNLFGESNNTDFIKSQIAAENQNKLGGFDKLLAIIGSNAYSERFKRGFEGLTKIMQDTVMEHFIVAKSRNGSTCFFSDDDLIKDVTPERETTIKIYELRIFKPVAYRVYFYESNEKVYLAIIEKKPPKKVQTFHINSSKDIIKELIIKGV